MSESSLKHLRSHSLGSFIGTTKRNRGTAPPLTHSPNISDCLLTPPLAPPRQPPPKRFAPRDPSQLISMPNINAQALFNACVVGDAAAVSRLLPVGGTPRNLSGPRFQCPDDTKSTPLIAAAMGGHTDIVRMILERAPNTPVDDAVATRATALMGSALYHHADIIRLLAARGANVNAESQGGRTPLRLAVGRINPNASHRDPDPDGAWQIATVRALLRLGAGTLPPAPRATLLLFHAVQLILFPERTLMGLRLDPSN